MTARQDADELVKEFTASVWQEWKLRLRGRKFENQDLVWSMVCNRISRQIYEDARAARLRVNDERN